MKKFDLKKAILENKATFYSSLNENEIKEGDLMKNIGKGLEYEATEEMIRDYASGLFGDTYEPEDLADFYLQNPSAFPKSLDHEFFKNNYDDILSLAMTGLDEGKMRKPGLKEGVRILDRQADLDQAYFNLDVDGTEMGFSYWDYDEEFDNATYEEVMYMIEKQLINVDKYGFPVDPQLTPEQKEEIAQVVLKDLQTNPGWKSNLKENKKEYYKDAEADDAEHIKALEKDMADDKKSSKMKKSELKAKIKEMVLAEMNIDVTDETGAYDFLAELEGMLDEAEGLTPLQDYVYQYEIEISGEDQAQEFLDDIKKLNTPDDVYDYYAYERDWQGNMDDDLENIYKQVKRKFKNLSEAEEEIEDEVEVDVEEPTSEPKGGIDVSQNADADLTGIEKQVQDNLEAAMEAAKQLNDEKLQQQIGNSLTFFTRQHVVKEDLNESMFPMLKKIIK